MNDAAVALTPEMLKALAGLRELQWVGEASIGLAFDGRWWIAAVLVLLTVFGLVIHWKRQPQQRALATLQQLRADYSCTGNVTAYVSALAGLLRQVATAGHGRAICPAGITGMAWLEWLDQHAPTADCGAFSGGHGRALDVLPYARPAAGGGELVDVDALQGLAERWLRAGFRR